jgi:hypothetical protein
LGSKEKKNQIQKPVEEASAYSSKYIHVCTGQHIYESMVETSYRNDMVAMVQFSYENMIEAMHESNYTRGQKNSTTKLEAFIDQLQF